MVDREIVSTKDIQPKPLNSTTKSIEESQNLQYAFSFAAMQALFSICSSGTVNPGIGGASLSWVFCGVLGGSGEVAREEPGRGERSIEVVFWNGA